MNRKLEAIGLIGGITIGVAATAGYLVDRCVRKEIEFKKQINNVNFTEPEIIDVKFKEIKKEIGGVNNEKRKY